MYVHSYFQLTTEFDEPLAYNNKKKCDKGSLGPTQCGWQSFGIRAKITICEQRWRRGMLQGKNNNIPKGWHAWSWAHWMGICHWHKKSGLNLTMKYRTSTLQRHQLFNNVAAILNAFVFAFATNLLLRGSGRHFITSGRARKACWQVRRLLVSPWKSGRYLRLFPLTEPSSDNRPSRFITFLTFCWVLWVDLEYTLSVLISFWKAWTLLLHNPNKSSATLVSKLTSDGCGWSSVQDKGCLVLASIAARSCSIYALNWRGGVMFWESRKQETEYSIAACSVLILPNGSLFASVEYGETHKLFGFNEEDNDTGKSVASLCRFVSKQLGWG